MMSKILYLSGQRKRKRVATVREVRGVGRSKAYRIVKLWREAWIKESDVVETKIEETAGSLDGDERGNKAKAEANPDFVKWAKENIPLKAIAGVNGQGEAVEGIREAQGGMAEGKNVCVRGADADNGHAADLFPEIASSVRRASRKGETTWDAHTNGILESSLPDGSSLDRNQSKSGEGTRVDPPTLEQPRLSKAEIDATKKRIYRGVRSGRRNLAEFSDFIGRMAERNDRSFFIRLAKALQARKI